ncbi:alpha-amylase family glycosyl hydrolase [Epilithonimonas arachidiradicis]|uniref:Alpha amylase catalytic subunit n=1 Tax=Epilithonimonas arachidiradicis TaxID=1617282 RepID=A0A420D8Q7_9FLAO|nr:alpha-amylase family glycosyl hydrolase [Epilithonimonas arachidiradicis]RKE87161.1 alpha amylase catalytic subunit [Epilithonimonas arachidiradicis]GGG58721.1 alpha-amlyase [Epilithonimonas arachidiradicis]
MHPASDQRYQPKSYVEITTPEWVKSATLYELNVRQFSEEGTFEAVIKQLPRLKKLGIDIIWLMPIHPIGELHRKGSLGSYYSVKDYLDVNPEFGTKDDFRNLVRAIHEEGMFVILDWVANHTSWDNNLVTEHPDWYRRSRKNTFQSTRWRDYDDIIEFDYSHPELRRYMTDALKYWIKEFDIDGYRCDIASFVPIDFWENVRSELDGLKPVFMLAEAEDKDLHKRAFDATYNWSLWNILHQIAVNHYSVKTLTEAYLAEHVSIFPKEAIRMNFIDNHDKNSWEGTPYSNFGAALNAATIFTFMMDGIPLVYNGQEAGLNRSLEFFEKDAINWQAHDNARLYSTIFALKHRNQALWNGCFGGEMVRIMNDKMDQVISFVREKNGHKVLVFINLSQDTVIAQFDTSFDKGLYVNLFSEAEQLVDDTLVIEMAPWDYVVLHHTL